MTKFNVTDLKLLLGGDEYFTSEQINWLCMKLLDPKSNSFYFQSVMSADRKRILLTKPDDE